MIKVIKTSPISKFYFFRQNNVRGVYKKDSDAGIGPLVIIEGTNAKVANRIAINIGIYFNGVNNDIDCKCCGDRWSAVDDAEYDFVDDDISYEKHIKGKYFLCGDEVYVHTLNGGVITLKE